MNFSIITFMQPGDWFVFVAVFGALQAVMLMALFHALRPRESSK